MAHLLSGAAPTAPVTTGFQPPTPTLYPLLLAAALTALITMDRARIVVPGFLLCGICAMHSLYLGVPLEFWSHVLFGVLCIGAASIVARTGRPVCILPWQGGLAVLVFAGLLLGEYLTVGFGRLHYVAHAIIELDCLVLSLSFTAEAVVSACCAPACAMPERADTALRRVRMTRMVIDPCGLAAIGCVFLRHRHDSGAVAILFHRAQAAMLLALAPVVGAVAAAATSGTVGPGLHALHTLCWMVNGVWLIAMAVLMYLWPTRHGIHHVFFESADPEEAITTYLALTLLCSGVAVAGLVRPAAGDGVQPVKAEADEDEPTGGLLPL